jgi:hypothetical protein
LLKKKKRESPANFRKKSPAASLNLAGTPTTKHSCVHFSVTPPKYQDITGNFQTLSSYSIPSRHSMQHIPIYWQSIKKDPTLNGILPILMLTYHVMLLTHEPCVNVRWTVQFSHALLAKTPARVAGAEKQGEVPCRGHENNSKSQETLMLADSQQLQNCEHVTSASHSNGQNDELNHNR